MTTKTSIPKQHKATVLFSNEDDLKRFLNYVDKAKKSEGTIGALHHGLLCEALKRAVIPDRGL